MTKTLRLVLSLLPGRSLFLIGAHPCFGVVIVTSPRMRRSEFCEQNQRKRNTHSTNDFHTKIHRWLRKDEEDEEEDGHGGEQSGHSLLLFSLLWRHIMLL